MTDLATVLLRMEEHLERHKGKTNAPVSLDGIRTLLDALAAAAIPAEPLNEDEISAIDVQTTIRIEKLMCAKLGRQWSTAGISIVSLIDELAARGAAIPAEPVADPTPEMIEAVRVALGRGLIKKRIGSGDAEVACRAMLKVMHAASRSDVLRDALVEIANTKDMDVPNTYIRGWNDGRYRLREIARAALADTGGAK